MACLEKTLSDVSDSLEPDRHVILLHTFGTRICTGDTTRTSRFSILPTRHNPTSSFAQGQLQDVSALLLYSTSSPSKLVPVQYLFIYSFIHRYATDLQSAHAGDTAIIHVGG